MTDLELLQDALDALKHLCLHSAAIRGYDGEQVQTAIDALRARLAQPEQEPVAWISHNAGLYHGKPDESLKPLPLYTAPPQREWVGLTDEEVDDIGCDFATLGGDIDAKDWFAFYLSIEAKLKEKNN